jgi:hypothetical protein
MEAKSYNPLHKSRKKFHKMECPTFDKNSWKTSSSCQRYLQTTFSKSYAWRRCTKPFYEIRVKTTGLAIAADKKKKRKEKV